MVYSVSQYILSVKHLDIMSRTLGTRRIIPIYEDEKLDKLRCFVGNSVLVFQVKCNNKLMAMRVYMRPHRNLKAIYVENYYPKELLVCSNSESYGLADVVLCDWHEGVSLQSKIEELAGNAAKMAYLSKMFDEFAISLLNEKWAHGDLKPENIIFTDFGLRLIDFDAMYCEGASVDSCEEIGTRQYQHPLRDNRLFNKSIDDYSIALISTALAALSLDSKLSKILKDSDYLLISPHRAVEGNDEVLDYIEKLFAERGDALHYRIARLLHSSTPSLPRLKLLLESQVRKVEGEEGLTLEYYNGYWGFARKGIFVIPPIYDLAFEYSEGFALVRIGDVWHFIDELGNIALTCGRGKDIKPLRNGATRMVRDDGREVIIHIDGRVDEL